MAKAGGGTSIKEAIARWEEKNAGQKASEAKVVKLYCQTPLVDKMDGALSQLKECEYLSLSTNSIEKIANLNALKNLKILSLGRNYIKSFVGLEAVGDTLEQLWISYNLIDKMKGVNVLKKLKILYMMHNRVKDIKELDKLKDMDALENLNFTGNPCREEIGNEDVWRQKITTLMPKIRKLDNKPTAGGGDDSKDQNKDGE